MAVLGRGGVGAAGERVQRRVGAVEIVIGAGIDHDARERAAAMRALDHLATGRRRRDVVIGADQHQGRHPRAPPQACRDPAVRIERDRGAEIGTSVARRALRTHGPEQRAGAIRPADQADAVARNPTLLHQPGPRSRDVGNALAPRLDAHLLDAALRPELARAVAVREQHGIAGLQEALSPIAIARQNGIGMAAEPAAAMQRDHGRKRPRALRLVELRMQHAGRERNLDRLRRRRRVRGRHQEGQEQGG